MVRGFNFQFKQPDSVSDIRGVIDFLAKQPLGYPNYEDWVQRTEAELQSGYKRAIMALSDNKLVGDLVYQPHKQIPRVREIKNLRVHPKLRKRDFAHFMLRQAEEHEKEGFDALLIDARTDNPPMINFLTFCGYVPIAQASLYDSNCPDVIMMKFFNERTKNGIVYNTKKIILS
ncbi:MAG: GNAT family N-acetyltransferase [Nanoarchaeota archaeon]